MSMYAKKSTWIHQGNKRKSSEFSFYCATKIQRNVCSLNFTIAWQPLMGSGNTSTFLSCWLADLFQFDCGSRHFETFWWHSWWSWRYYLHVHHSNVSTKQNLPLAAQDLTVSVSTPGCFSDILNLTDELISDTCAATRPFLPVLQIRQLVLLHFLSLNGSDLCNIYFRATPDCSTTFILKKAKRQF